MGKGILLAVSFAIAGASLLLFGGQRSSLETKEAQGDYQYTVIARDVAKSGFERGVSTIKREMMAAPGTFNHITMRGGYYDPQITPNLYGDLDLNVDAHSGEARHEMDGNAIFTAPLPAALVVEDEHISVTGAGDYKISGVDVRMPARGIGAGYRDPVPGVMTRTFHTSTVSGGLQASQVVGQGTSYKVDEGSISGAYDETALEALYNEAKDKATGVDGTTISFSTPAAVREGMFRSAASASNAGNPQIVRVQGNLHVDDPAPLHGYGLLLVEDGDLSIKSPDFQWDGLIMVRKKNTDSVWVRLENNAQVRGGFVAYDKDVGASLDCVPDFHIDGNTTVVDDSFMVYVEVLGAAISYGGQYDMPVTARIHVGNQVFEPWGSYNQPLDANLNKTGHFTFAPATGFTAGTGIRIDAKSWKRKDGFDGSENSHWEVHMEKDSQTVDSRLAVLRDGDDVPNVAGFLDQNSVMDFVSDYVEGDKIKMDQNEDINLFELGMNNPASPAHDMQDLVLRISLVDASVGGCVPGSGESYLSFTILDNAQVHYSSEAFAKLGLRLNGIRNNSTVTLTENATKGTGRKETLQYDATVVPDDNEDDPETTQGGSNVVICHKPHKDGGTSKTIPRKKMGKHIAHGDYVGACTGGDDD